MKTFEQWYVNTPPAIKELPLPVVEEIFKAGQDNPHIERLIAFADKSPIAGYKSFGFIEKQKVMVNYVWNEVPNDILQKQPSF